MTVKEKIVEHAVRMFANSGIKAITMDDISREAGVSKRTIYENFRDKNELLCNCLDFMAARYNEEYERIESEADNMITMVFNFMKQGFRMSKTINPLFISDLRRYHYDIWKHILVESRQKQESQALNILMKGISQGLFREKTDIRIIGKLLIAQMRLIADDSVFPEEEFSKTDVFEKIYISLFRGISTQKGLEYIDNYLNDKSEHFMVS